MYGKVIIDVVQDYLLEIIKGGAYETLYGTRIA